MIGCLALPALLAGVQIASVSASPPAPVVRATDAGYVLPAGLPVEVEVIETISSKSALPDAVFAIRLRTPIRIGDVEIVPAGTPGDGEITHAAKARFGGKPGELVLAVRYLDYRGTRIPLRRFTLGGTGSSHVDAAVVANAVVPIVGALVAGGEKVVPAGCVGGAVIATDTVMARAR